METCADSVTQPLTHVRINSNADRGPLIELFLSADDDKKNDMLLITGLHM